MEKSEIPGMYKLITPVQRWIPERSGGRYVDCPRYISTEETVTGSRRFDVAELIFKQKSPAWRHMAAGEYFVIREALRRENPNFSRNIGRPEMTGTLLFYPERGRKRIRGYHSGFLIDIPETDEKGMIIKDEKGIPKGRYVFEMALPIKGMFFRQMGRNLRAFKDVVHGKKDARLHDIGDNYFNMNSDSEGVRILVRGLCNVGGGPQDWHPGMTGHWGPYDSVGGVTSRGVMD
jgi:hypothetical protein